MLYKKNQTDELDMKLFQNPTCEYRGTPFWAWNCKLEKEVLTEQIEYLKEMGFGGFHIHSRCGMSTEYLSPEFMDLVKTCMNKAKQEEMLTWLYDEDRWPSGAAGGFVTKNPKYRQKYLYFTREPLADAVEKELGITEGKAYLLACYDIILNEKGELESYARIEENAASKGKKWYAYVKTKDTMGWFNNQTYVDTMSKEAIDTFIDITHEAYKREVGNEFGKNIPAIFTDEPNYFDAKRAAFAKGEEPISMPWTTDFDQSYTKQYGVDLLAHLPELFWELPESKPTKVRYCFYDHAAELFSTAFMDNIGKWCSENGFAMTGHVLEEQTLASQTRCVGEAMRSYRSMGIPGIDMLCDATEYSTAKQAQSAVHQFGREGMMSELYGVTNWDFDFRGHKFQGDWQAALGVTVRVPHLAWVSMKGSAKRDYPASINYQSPWFREYPYIEDHFARLNTVLTRGKPIVNVGVIHPVESCWLHYGPADATSEILKELDDNFSNVIEWLLFGLIDFDFISESLLSTECRGADQKLNVGEMSYSTVIIPGCDTIRRSTFEYLKQFREKGGELIFCGACPRYIDAEETDEIEELYRISTKTQMNKNALLKALEKERFVEIREQNGQNSKDLIYALRQDHDVQWLFITHGVKSTDYDVVHKEGKIIRIKGEVVPVLYDTLSGESKAMDYTHENGNTIIRTELFCFDSLLIQLTKGSKKAELSQDISEVKPVETIDFKTPVSFSLEEPNVYLLDIAEYKLDDEEFQPEEEVLRIDKKCRKILNYPMADGRDIQPWLIKEASELHSVTLRFGIKSDIEVMDTLLAAEEVEKIELNGMPVDISPVGYYCDRAIKTFSLPPIQKGMNTLIVKVPLGKRLSVECLYLLGSFGVSLVGTQKRIIKLKDTLGFGSVTDQGLPFYGGNITYKTEIEVAKDGAVQISAGRYRGAFIKVLVDGKEVGKIVFPPYTITIDGITKGKHTIEFVVFGTRINTFGSLHNYSKDNWYGSGHWYSEDGKGWCYEYVLREVGLLSSPVITIG